MELSANSQNISPGPVAVRDGGVAERVEVEGEGWFPEGLGQGLVDGQSDDGEDDRKEELHERDDAVPPKVDGLLHQ